jgi:prepilin-type N-terminal cleavage/methylation domain-containing protein
MTRTSRNAFTIVEMLVVVSIITILMGLLLPAVNSARNQAKMTQSQNNLRQIGTAHANYAAAWDGRQFTAVDDSMASYGDTPEAAVNQYFFAHDQEWHQPLVLGWGTDDSDNFVAFHFAIGEEPLADMLAPLVFTPSGSSSLRGFGWYRIPNAAPLAKYLGGRFYDPVFYAPKDTAVWTMFKRAVDSPEEYVDRNRLGGICYSSYSMSPAGLFNPAVLGNPERGGFQDPWSLPAGLRCPSLSQARYPELKTHMIEQHWLQNKRGPECSPYTGDVEGLPGRYDGCDPYFFNGSIESSPVTLFYDGHVENLGVEIAVRADSRMRVQTNDPDWGLWSKDTPFGGSGFFGQYGWDSGGTAAPGSFHILTTDGILGRDMLSDS